LCHWPCSGSDSRRRSSGRSPRRACAHLRWRPAAWRRVATSGAGCWRPPPPPRRQVRLRRPGHLAGPDHHPGHHRRPVRHRDRAGVGGLHPHAAPPPRPRQRWTAADRARHHHPRPSRAGPRPDSSTQGAVAVVGQPGQLDLELVWRAYTRSFDLEHTSGSASRPWAGPRRGRARPSRPSGGPGWCWPATPSCAWPASSWPISGCRGSDPARPGSCRPTGSAGGLAPAVHAGVAGCRAETLRALARSPQGHRSGPALRHPAINKPTTKPTKKARKKPTRAAKAA
jgi:hypothetical protein